MCTVMHTRTFFSMHVAHYKQISVALEVHIY